MSEASEIRPNDVVAVLRADKYQGEQAIVERIQGRDRQRVVVQFADGVQRQYRTSDLAKPGDLS